MPNPDFDAALPVITPEVKRFVQYIERIFPDRAGEITDTADRLYMNVGMARVTRKMRALVNQDDEEDDFP